MNNGTQRKVALEAGNQKSILRLHSPAILLLALIMSSKRPSNQDNSPKKKQKVQSSVRNFFSANVIDLTTGESETKNVDSADASANSSTQYKIFCDLDGVLVDFEAGVKKLNRGKSPDDLKPSVLWGSIARSYRFFENAPWTKDGKKLWQHLVNASQSVSNSSTIKSIDILTGVPSNFEYRGQKYRWCERELSFAWEESEESSLHRRVEFNHVDMAAKRKQHERVSGSKRKSQTNAPVVNVITCHSKLKYMESRRGHVLIDDREELGIKWSSAGGIFIHHTSTENTLKKLKEKGILVLDGNDDSIADKKSSVKHVVTKTVTSSSSSKSEEDYSSSSKETGIKKLLSEQEVIDLASDDDS